MIAPPMLPPDEDETREVYARFGLAYYMTECVHRALVHVVALLPLDKETAARPRVEEKMGAAEQLTFGQLVPQAKVILDEALHASLDWALAQRNFLAHGFWYERIHMMASTESKNELVEELQDVAHRFHELDQILDALVFAHYRRLGMTDEMFHAAMSVSRTEPVEPLPRRRIPKADERIAIVKAWIVRGIDIGSALVLEDASGERWQLCDSGLGWSYLKEPEASAWSPCSELKLPAQIVARPKGAANWTYELNVSTGSRICVDPHEGKFRWRIRPTVVSRVPKQSPNE